LFLEVVVLVVGLESLQDVWLLGILPPRVHYGDGRSGSFEKERRDVPRAFFRGFGPPPVERVGSLVVVFVEVALVGKMVWFVLTPLSSKWLGTGFTLLVLVGVLDRQPTKGSTRGR
jgi:hypothetical protein